MVDQDRRYFPENAPRENFARGLYQADLGPAFGQAIRGKVRDSWVGDFYGDQIRVLATTDRASAYDNVVCAVPGKGQVLNLTSRYWFDVTKDLIPNHVIDVPHPNVLIARQAVATLPVEMVLRRYMAESSTSTSIFDNYTRRGRRNIYGIDFPDGLVANQDFGQTIVTPTTKAEQGHDEELTDDQAKRLVDDKLGVGVWDRAKEASVAVFERIRELCLEKGLIFVDTKLEFGLDSNGDLMLIDEIGTPDSSRFWLASTYDERMSGGQRPDSFDKEMLRRFLAEKGFRGEGPIPVIDPVVIDAMSRAYTVPYQMTTGLVLPQQPEPEVLANEIRESVINYLAG